LIKTEYRQSRIHGFGRFTLEDIKADEIVLVLTGYIGVKGSMPIQGTKLFIDNPQTHINHSSMPNLRLDGQILFRSCNDIAAGSELTLDYRTFTQLNFVPVEESIQNETH
jgi:SET domain-containing protein